MKFFTRLFLSLFLLAGLAACDKVPAGHVGVKVYLLGGSKGVDSETLDVGRYWIGINEELYLFPTFMQNREWTADGEDQSFNFQTRDGMKASADVGISYQFEKDKISQIFQTYRRGVDEITDLFIRNMVRDALVKEVSSKPIEYVYGEGKSELITNVQTTVQKQLEGSGIVVNKIYWIGDIRVPEIVTLAINNKIEATQRAQQRTNEIEQVKAEAEKARQEAQGVADSQRLSAQAKADAILLEAKAQAEANRLLSQSLSTELTHYMSIEKWNGELPSTMIPGAAVPMIGLSQ